MPTTGEDASVVMQHYVTAIEQELSSETPDSDSIENILPHLWRSMKILGIHTYQTDGLTGKILQDARHLVTRAKDFLEHQTLRLSVPDEATSRLIAKQGKVIWAMSELEAVLPPEAAQKVDTLKHRVADELGAIILNAGKSIELKK